MSATPDVHLSDLLAAREDLAIIEKTSSASVRKNTQSAINKVIIGRVSINSSYLKEKTKDYIFQDGYRYLIELMGKVSVILSFYINFQCVGI